eukprot:jgi/Galph1/264/GphlegSOOS_G5009.1
MNGAGYATPEESLDALYNLTLCVYLDLIAFSQEGTHFEYIFYENICKSALSEFPNAAELLSEVLPLILHGTSRWLPKLLRVINQKYLYLMVAVFSTMLLASALEIPLHTHGTHSYLMNLGIHSNHVLDIVSDFGFYYTSDEASSTFTLVYPKIVLKYLETHYKQIPVFRFISHLFSTIIPSDSPVGGGLKLEILFSLVVYLKLCFCSKLGEISIFQKTFVENYLLVKVDDVQSRKRIPLPQYVTSFNSSVSGDASTADTTYHSNAWNIFYDVFLSKEDGIFIPFSQYSKGPDLIIRLSKNVTEETISPSHVTDSTQLVTFSSQQGPIVYLIGISLKCYHLAGQGAGLSLIKNETEKFLIPVAQQLDLETKNIVAIRLVVSTKYTKKVIRQFTDHQNWLMNSRLYYENDNGQLLCQSLSSAPASGFANEWLRIPSRCQLVVCLTTSLQSFLVEKHTVNWNMSLEMKMLFNQIPLSSALTSWLQAVLKDEPRQRRQVGFGMEMRSDAYAMQVEYTREAQSARASSSMEFSIDWKSFLLHKVRLDENRVNEYISKLPPAPVALLKYITFQDLMRSGLKEEDVMKILFGLCKVSANH